MLQQQRSTQRKTPEARVRNVYNKERPAFSRAAGLMHLLITCHSLLQKTKNI
jgi:hypothetical protein